MIAFFRKLRQRLLAESQLSKYLLYALGEILLVVIGNLVWLNVAPVHCVVLWQVAHVVGNAAATWFGFEVLL